MLQPLDPITALAGFRRALRQFLAASEVISRRRGVTQQQYQALLAMAAWPVAPMTIKDLAAELLVTHHGAVQLLDRLAELGLVMRRASEQDGRKVELDLTPDGLATVQALAEMHHQELLEHQPALSSSLERLRI